MLSGMLRDALPRLGDRLRRYHRGTTAPALVSVLIAVAMITGQVTPAVDLEDELPERQDGPAFSQGSDG
jgi:Flp pilus assembly pilin Flp